MGDAMAALDTELETYKTLLPRLLVEQGKFALIKGKDLIGTFESYADALKVGYDRFGMDHFLVKKISPDEQVAYFSRDLRVSCQA
jgi:hypothetical protein